MVGVPANISWNLEVRFISVAVLVLYLLQDLCNPSAIFLLVQHQCRQNSHYPTVHVTSTLRRRGQPASQKYYFTSLPTLWLSRHQGARACRFTPLEAILEVGKSPSAQQFNTLNYIDPWGELTWRNNRPQVQQELFSANFGYILMSLICVDLNKQKFQWDNKHLILAQCSLF